MEQAHPRKGLLFIGVIALVLALGIGLRIQTWREDAVPPPAAQPAASGDEVRWLTYKNEQYGFEIQYPSTWQVMEDTQIPGVHIYKKGSVKPEYLTHHTNFTNVSVYPEGIGTEGVMGETEASIVTFKEPVKNAVDYVLDDGTRWATMASFIYQQADWEPWGYVWARTEIKDEKVSCINGTQVTEGNCDIGIEFEGSRTARAGSIDVSDREVAERILSTFTFIK